MNTSRETYLRGVGYEPVNHIDTNTYEGMTEWLAQQEIKALVKIFGREIAQEKVANMLLIAFKETGR